MVRRMFLRVCAILLATVALAGCGRWWMNPRADGARGVLEFFQAVRSGDRKSFDAAVDRPALHADLRGQLADVGRQYGLEVEGGASEFSLDRLITPQAFVLTDVSTGRPLTGPPALAQIANALQVSDRGHVCLMTMTTRTCVLRFTRHEGRWRLTGMPARQTPIALPHNPPGRP
jgi:hypothetical protein